MPFPYLSLWILETVAVQYWFVWFLSLLCSWGCARLASKGWRFARPLARLCCGLVWIWTLAVTAAFGFDLRLALTSPGSALVVKGEQAEFGVICADASGRIQLRTYQISPDLGIDLAIKAGRYRERPIPIIRLLPEVSAPPRPKQPVTGSGRGEV